MPTRRSNRRKIDEPAAESTKDAPAPTTPASNKCQRIATQLFEQGVNPITPPSTVSRPSQRPSASQASEAEALFVREDSPVGGEDSDDDGQDDEADPNPEVDADAEALGDADGEAAVEVVAAARLASGRKSAKGPRAIDRRQHLRKALHRRQPVPCRRPHTRIQRRRAATSPLIAAASSHRDGDTRRGVGGRCCCQSYRTGSHARC